MAKSAKDVAIQVGSFTVAGLLMWLALRGVDFNAVVTSLAQANYWWLLPIVIVSSVPLSKTTVVGSPRCSQSA